MRSPQRTGLQALALKAQYEAAVGDPKQQSALLDQLKSLVAGCASSAALLAAAQVCLAADEIPAAYQFVVAAAAAGGGGSSGGSVEGTACKIQILLKLDRPDLAQAELLTLQRVAEESILADLCAVYVLLYGGGSATAAADAEHTLTALVEQYGPSVYLTNLLAVALAARGEYAAAEAKLTDCLREFADMPPPQRHETQVNLVTVLTQQGKMADAAAVVEQIVGASSGTSSCSLHFAANLDRVTVAFDREAAKYKV